MNFAPNDFGDVLVQYDDDHSSALEPIPGVLIAAGYVALPDEGMAWKRRKGLRGRAGTANGAGDRGRGGGVPVEEAGGNTRRGAGSDNMSQVRQGVL